MTYSNLFKQLKRRLRLRKRWLTLGAYLLLAGAISAALWTGANRDTSADSSELAQAMSLAVGQPSDEESLAATRAVMETIEASTEPRQVFIHTSYVCGEEMEQLGLMQTSEIVGLKERLPDASVMLDETGNVHIATEIYDLAPRCRENAYFGLDNKGNLSLFDGNPNQDVIIRTFFQLDIQYMKSSLPEDVVNELYSGIRVADLIEYNSVLSSFSKYAVDPTVSGSDSN